MRCGWGNSLHTGSATRCGTPTQSRCFASAFLIKDGGHRPPMPPPQAGEGAQFDPRTQFDLILSRKREEPMKAYVYGANGAEITDVAKPSPKGTQVLVKVHACGLNRSDLV